MASTNKTTNYDLSQYIGTDKPTYLTDYNQDMSKIDSGIHAAKSEADNNATSIGTLSNLTTTAKTDLVSAVNEIDGEVTTNTNNIATNTSNIATNTTHIGTLTNLTTSSKTDLVVAANEINAKVGDLTSLNTSSKSSVVSAINEVDGEIKKFNFTHFDDYSTTATTTAGTITASDLHVATNEDGSIAKVYGAVSISNSGAISGTLTIPTTRLRPSSSITINGGLLKAAYISSGINGLTTESITIDTSGNITFPVTASQYATSTQYILINSVIFLQDFGDTPQPSNN